MSEKKGTPEEKIKPRYGTHSLERRSEIERIERATVASRPKPAIATSVRNWWLRQSDSE